MRQIILFLMVMAVLPLAAQKSSFDEFRKQQRSQFERTKADQQAKYDAFRREVNEKYAEFMRKPWGEADEQEADTIVPEQSVRPYIVFDEQDSENASDTGAEEDYMAEEGREARGEGLEEDSLLANGDIKPFSAEAAPPVNREDAPGDSLLVIGDSSLVIGDSLLAINDSVEEDTFVIKWEKVLPIPVPKASVNTEPVQIPVRSVALIMPGVAPAPKPIAPVAPKAVPQKPVSIAYYGAIITIQFPKDDPLKIRELTENGIADAWLQLSDSIYDNTIKSALDVRKKSKLCDWAYMDMLRQVTEKQYGQTNEAVLAQAFIMTQSGYRIRIGRNETQLYLLSASQYDIFALRYFMIDGSKFYIVNGERNAKMFICEAKIDKEQPLSMQMADLPQIGDEQTPKRTFVSRKGMESSTSVNKNLIDFFNNYPQACYKGEQSTRWVAYANTPLENSIKKMLYPPLQQYIKDKSEKDAVTLLLNWVQTAFAYEYDDKVWGGDRAFFAQETLFYPYCDCEDRSILFSRLVRDLMNLDVIFLYYPGHLATAVGFKDDVQGDWVEYNGKKYVVCDPTYINAGVGRTMPGMNNQQAQIIALK